MPVPIWIGSDERAPHNNPRIKIELNQEIPVQLTPTGVEITISNKNILPEIGFDGKDFKKLATWFIAYRDIISSYHYVVCNMGAKKVENPNETLKSMKSAGEICNQDYYSYDLPGTALCGIKKILNENNYEVSIWDNLSYTAELNDAFTGKLELATDEELLYVKAYKHNLYCFLKKNGAVTLKEYELSVIEDKLSVEATINTKEIFKSSDNVSGIADCFARTETESGKGTLYVIAETSSGNGLFSLSLDDFGTKQSLIAFTDALNPTAFIGIKPGKLILSAKQTGGNSVITCNLTGETSTTNTNATFMVR